MSSDETADRSPVVPVSVVIPAYQCRDTITRAINSVFAQTCLPRETIVVDDGSTDGTAEIVNELSQSQGSDWLKIIVRPENGGPSLARNLGWSVATQPYIAFLDADDSWHPRKLEVQYRYMKTRPDVDITAHRSIGYRDPPQDFHAGRPHRDKPISRGVLLLSNRLPTSTVMLKRELPLRFDSEKRVSEDYLLWLELICGDYKGVIIDAPLALKYKAAYGEGGLSARLWEMELGEIDTYRQLSEKRLIHRFWQLLLIPWSLAKYVLRVLITLLRR
ncbi:MAG: glycosyltransferase [Gammaproteobacteria bacterium]|nr:glycosyltransferase [Gammaproteobacteria bacterium]